MAEPTTAEVSSAPTPPSAPHEPRGELPRQLGLWSAVAVVAGITIGSGIFRTPAGVANRLPGPLPIFLVWIAGGVTALCGALTLAEVAGAFPETGGIYVFIRRGFGDFWAFLFGWAELAVIRAAAVGAIATTFAEYFLRVLGFDPTIAPYSNWVHYVAAVAIAVASSAGAGVPRSLTRARPAGAKRSCASARATRDPKSVLATSALGSASAISPCTMVPPDAPNTTDAALAAALSLAGCFTRGEVIEIRPDGSARVTVTMEGDEQDYREGEALAPPAGWRASRETSVDREGKRQIKATWGADLAGESVRPGPTAVLRHLRPVASDDGCRGQQRYGHKRADRRV